MSDTDGQRGGQSLMAPLKAAGSWIGPPSQVLVSP